MVGDQLGRLARHVAVQVLRLLTGADDQFLRFLVIGRSILFIQDALQRLEVDTPLQLCRIAHRDRSFTASIPGRATREFLLGSIATGRERSQRASPRL